MSIRAESYAKAVTLTVCQWKDNIAVWHAYGIELSRSALKNQSM